MRRGSVAKAQHSERRDRNPRSGQMAMLKSKKSAYGGQLRNTRAGREGARPLSVRDSMHLVLRSSKAKGEWSFLRSRNAKVVKSVVEKFAFVYGVKILSLVNVGNHLHLHIRLGSRFSYKPFVRAITGSIAMAITGKNRWTQARIALAETISPVSAAQSATAITSAEAIGVATAVATRFWDHRPFTRVVSGFKAARRLIDYLRINEMEGWGFSKFEARGMFEIERKLQLGISTWGAG
jgi:REP element-mobilizing transposase RayT